jgi:hypothetical protein
MGPRVRLGIFEEGGGESLVPCWDLNTNGLVQSLVTILTMPSQLEPILGGKRKMKAIILLQLLTLCMKYFFSDEFNSVATTANCRTAVKES